MKVEMSEIIAVVRLEFRMVGSLGTTKAENWVGSKVRWLVALLVVLLVGMMD